jgi:feruloyl esterase
VNTADLTEFLERGGKIRIVQGWNDYPVRPARVIKYLTQAEAANGGAARTSEFLRLFMVPGMWATAAGGREPACSTT